MEKSMRENKLFSSQVYINDHLICLIIIFLLFLASFLLRLPYLDRSLSDHHEWVTAQSLIALENWEIQGALKHNFNLLQTYQLEADKFIKNMGINRMDEEGNGYYASFPPFSIILPYITFKFLSININIMNLQIFNLIFHLISSLFIYHTVRIALPSSSYGTSAAFLAGILFIFLAPNLWFFSNIYSWDIFWHHIWIIYICCVLLAIVNLEQNTISNRSLYLIGILNFFSSIVSIKAYCVRYQ